MKHYVYFLQFIFIILLPVNIQAQEENFGFCQLTQEWGKIRIDTTNNFEHGYSKILVVTCRPYVKDPKKNEYFPNDIAEFRTVSYFIASCDGSSWNISFVPSFEEGMKQIDNGHDLLLFTDGHGKTLPMVLSRAFQVQERYGVSLILFDWPSRNNDFNVSLSRVRSCSDNFYNLLLQIKDYKKEFMSKKQNFSILLHSLGNYFLTHIIVNGSNQYLQEKFVDNIIMNAPAIRSKKHSEVISQLSFQNRIYITWNKNDFILKGAGIITAQKMLGNVIINPSSNSQYIDFTNIAGKEHTSFAGYHSFEYENPAVFYFYNTAIHGNKVSFIDENMFKQTPIQNAYNFAIMN